MAVFNNERLFPMLIDYRTVHFGIGIAGLIQAVAAEACEFVEISEPYPDLLASSGSNIPMAAFRNHLVGKDNQQALQ